MIHRSRSCRQHSQYFFEPLEDRRLLAHPAVTGVVFDYQTLPHRLIVSFDQNVRASLTADDPQVDQVTTADADPQAVSMSYDIALNKATFVFAGELPDGNYVMTLAAEDVANANGTHPLVDSVFSFFVLTGDVNHSRAVNSDDFNILISNFGQTPRTFAQGDLNYDGWVNSDDFNILIGRFGTMLDAPPSGPDDVSISSFTGSPQVTLNWQDAASGEQGYRIQRSFDGKEFSNLLDIPVAQYVYTTPGTLTYTDVGLPHGTRVWYRLRTYNSSVPAANTAYTPKVAATTMLPAPEVTNVEATSATELRVEWDDNSDTESAFDIKITGGGTTRTISNIRPDATSYVVGGLTEFTAYTVQVRARNSRIDSAWSAPSDPAQPWGDDILIYDEMFDPGPEGQTEFIWDDFTTAPHPMRPDEYVLGMFDNTTKTFTASGLPGHYALRFEFGGLTYVHGGAYLDPTFFKVTADGDEVLNAPFDDSVTATPEYLSGNWTLDHTGSTFTASFAGEGYDEETEKWCLTRVKLTLLRPIVSVSADADAAEPNVAGGFTVSRTGPTTSPLSVKLGFSGTASFQDHNNIASTVTIASGASTHPVPVIPYNDTFVEGSEDRVVHVQQDNNYVVGSSPATVWIHDNDGVINPIEPVPPQKPGGVPPPEDNDWPEDDDDEPDPAPTPVPPEPPAPPVPPGPEVENFVNLVIGGWAGFYGYWGWPYGHASTINIYGTTADGPGIPPTDESVFISVNDDFDEGNEDSNGNPLPDNMPDATAGHRIDYGPDGTWDWGWDLAGMYLYTSSTDGNPANPATYSLSFPSTVKIWRWDETPNDGTAWEEVESGETFDAAETDYVTGWWPGFVVEGIEPSQSLHDVGITATFTKGHSVQDTVRFTVMQTDLDIDSDNNDELDDPARTPQEDHIEQVVGDDDHPGKIIAVNDDDSDGDGVPDYADGYGLPSDEEDATDASPNDRLVPLKLSIPQPIDLSKARIFLYYSASNPWKWNDENYAGGQMKLTGDGSDEHPYIYEPLSGQLRIWKKDASQPRDAHDVHDGGDFVGSGLRLVGNDYTGYTPAQLGGGRDIDLYVEAIKPDQTLAASSIRVLIDPDGTGNLGWWMTTDLVRLTSAQVDIFAQRIHKDTPDEDTYLPLLRVAAERSVIYGGSERSTSDELQLMVEVTPEALAPTSFSWGVSNEDAVQNAPPNPGPATSYDVGYVLAGDSTLAVTVAATVFGAPIKGGRSFELGVRTDDTIVVGWINKGPITINAAFVNPLLTAAQFPTDGITEDATGAALTLLALQNGSPNFYAGGGNYVALTATDAAYLMNWLFKYGGNDDPVLAVAGGDFRNAGDTAIDVTEVEAFANDATHYKLFNRSQIRYRRRGSGFRGAPAVLQHRVGVGTTVDPLRLPVSLYPGQTGPAATLAGPLLALDLRVSSINDGSPDAGGINVTNTLASLLTNPLRYWENIGSRISFYHDGDLSGIVTRPVIVTQPYPTYYIYLNGKLRTELTETQAASPLENFHAQPYPFGAGGRDGDAESSPAVGSRIPQYTVP